MSKDGLSINELIDLIRDFIQARDWESFQKPSALALSAVVEIGELLELFQWQTDKEIEELLQNEDYRKKIANELADVLVYVFRIADVTGIDPTVAILEKMKLNEEKYPIKDWKGRIPDKVNSR